MDRNLKLWSLSPTEKAKHNKDRLLWKEISEYIASLKLPIYSSLKYYYYYDILESLSRNLF